MCQACYLPAHVDVHSVCVSEHFARMRKCVPGLRKGENILIFPIIIYHHSIGNGSCFEFSNGMNGHVGGVPRKKNVRVNNHGGAHSK